MTKILAFTAAILCFSNVSTALATTTAGAERAVNTSVGSAISSDATFIAGSVAAVAAATDPSGGTATATAISTSTTTYTGH